MATRKVVVKVKRSMLSLNALEGNTLAYFKTTLLLRLTLYCTPSQHVKIVLHTLHLVIIALSEPLRAGEPLPRRAKIMSRTSQTELSFDFNGATN